MKADGTWFVDENGELQPADDAARKWDGDDDIVFYNLVTRKETVK